jgi:predicted CXXCH cytochrome family protein
MKYLLSLLSAGSILVSGSLWAASPFDEVAQTPHNLLPSRSALGFKNICLSCHTDGEVMKEQDTNTPSEKSPASNEAQTEIPGPGDSSPSSISEPLWSPSSKARAFSLVSSLWSLEKSANQKPFGSSSACLSCHDGALALDVHGEQKGLEAFGTTRERFLDHPTAIPYPRRPDGMFATERPTLTLFRYWSIADRTSEGVAMPSGPVSSFFNLPSGVDPKDPAFATTVVRTSYGMIHCDSCHNPHINQYPPFLRTPPRDLCFVCHDR